MGIEDRKSRERAERERLIVATAGQIAEREGWNAVTVRRLADEIEYSQPVLYSHFENRDAIVAAVAVEGFRKLTSVILQAARTSANRRYGARDVALAYLAFGREWPALYEAMFTMPTSLRFAEASTKAELRDAFTALSSVVDTSMGDADLVTETFWAALHGLTELERSGRIRQSVRDDRVSLVISGILGG